MFSIQFYSQDYCIIAPNSGFIGASAAVMAIVTAIAFYLPKFRINLLFFGRIRLIHLAIALFVLDFLMISSNNPGGHLSHIGGCILAICILFHCARGDGF
jgi:membrane associated rhomboid family serine protease